VYKIIICVLFFIPIYCYGTQFLHDPTRPAMYTDNQQVLVLDSNSNKITLDEILISPFRQVAVVNGMALQVGDTESGIKILSISDHAVRVIKNQREMELVFPLPAHLLDQKSTIEIRN